jgi:hypothetical protein
MPTSILVFVLSYREGIIEISVGHSTYLRSVVGCNALPGSINVVVVVDEILFSVRTYYYVRACFEEEQAAAETAVRSARQARKCVARHLSLRTYVHKPTVVSE